MRKQRDQTGLDGEPPPSSSRSWPRPRSPLRRIPRRSSRRTAWTTRRRIRAPPWPISRGAHSSRSTGPRLWSLRRGEPDREKILGDSGKRVWETFKSDYELFQVDGDGRRIAPAPWASYAGPQSLRARRRQSAEDDRLVRAFRRLQPAELRRRRAGQSTRRAERRLHPLRNPFQRAGIHRVRRQRLESRDSIFPMRADRRAFPSGRSRSKRRGDR